MNLIDANGKMPQLLLLCLLTALYMLGFEFGQAGYHHKLPTINDIGAGVFWGVAGTAALTGLLLLIGVAFPAVDIAAYLLVCAALAAFSVGVIFGYGYEAWDSSDDEEEVAEAAIDVIDYREAWNELSQSPSMA